MARLKKGSKEAKEYMASIRRDRGKPKASRSKPGRKEYMTRTKAARRVGEKVSEKVNLLEAALFALAGYMTGTALKSSGIGPTVGTALANRSSTMGQFLYHEGSGDPSEQMTKLIGTGVGAKSIYDVMKKGGRIDKKTLSVEIPYAIGAILDPVKGASTSGQRW